MSVSVNMRVAWEQGNPQIKVIFCYAVLYYNMGTYTSMAGQAMSGSFLQLICPTRCYLCSFYVTLPGLSTLKLQGPMPPWTTLNSRHPRYNRDNSENPHCPSIYLSNPWTADTPLLRIMDNFRGPNCIQTILTGIGSQLLAFASQGWVLVLQ